MSMKIKAMQLVKISSAERLVTTLFFAVLLHGIVIFGVGFVPGENNAAQRTSFEVTLVQQVDSTTPTEADYLAQATQAGTGNTLETVRPQSALSSAEEYENTGISDAPDLQTTAEETDEANKQEQVEKAATEDRSILVTEGDSDSAATTENNAAADTTPRRMIARLMKVGTTQTQLISETRLRPLAQSDQPREKFVSVNTRESVYAAYIESWRKKVEKLGNLNYPDEARRDGLSGSLQLDVSLNADGTVREILTRIPSEHRVLDDAAMRIVRLASPFAPFSDAMRAETDVLSFTFEWRFAQSDGASSSMLEVNSRKR